MSTQLDDHQQTLDHVALHLREGNQHFAVDRLSEVDDPQALAMFLIVGIEALRARTAELEQQIAFLTGHGP